jgi:predicted DNA-binding transcriptional regulator AlpA
MSINNIKAIERANEQHDWLTLAEVASRYRVSIRSVQNWMKANKDFPEPLRFNRRTFRWRLADLERFEQSSD